MFKDVEDPILPDWEEAQVYLKDLERAFMANEQV
jgi:hypothetical protein